MGMSENTLTLFDPTKTLVYESLLHVAITRQKLRLHVGIPCREDDDIHQRFVRAVEDQHLVIPESGYFHFSKTTLLVNDISKFVQKRPEWSNKMDAAYISPRKLRDLITKEQTTGPKRWRCHRVGTSCCSVSYNALCHPVQHI